ncbi:MAG: hypothetical protein IPG81_25385 [Sandaracinaceae bacterium]|nr:hypothetical protein [Sandaracinaceae bacterium]
MRCPAHRGQRRLAHGRVALSQSTTASRVAPGAAALSEAGDSGLPDLAPRSVAAAVRRREQRHRGAGRHHGAARDAAAHRRRAGALSTLSNVLKARHDTAKSVVGNIR